MSKFDTTPIFAGEPIRYTGARHMWNNGFRRRWLANGEREASVINAARRGDINAVLARVDKMGGVRARMGITRTLINAAQRLTADVPAYRVERRDDGAIMVYTPQITWDWRKNKQVGQIEWLPMFGFQPHDPR